METITLHENGNTFQVTYKRADTKELNKNYIYIDEVSQEVVSKEQINRITVNEMNVNISKSLNP